MRAKVARRLRAEARAVAQEQGFPQRDTLAINHHPKRYGFLVKKNLGKAFGMLMLIIKLLFLSLMMEKKMSF